MRFAAFEWIIFLPLLLAAGFFLRSLKLWLPLRACCCGLILLLLMQPQIRQLEGGLDLWVLVDRSASAAETLAPRMAEIEALLSHSKSAEDRVFYIDYADLAQVRGEADEIPENKKQQTRTALAIRYALSKMKSNRASRLLLLTDGYSTEPLSGISERLVQQQVPLDYRLLSFPGTADWRIQELKLPPQAQINEPFLIEVSVAGQPDEPVDCTIFRDGTPIGSAKMNGVHGKGSVRFTDRLSVSGAHQYTAQISAQLDSRPGNNRAQRWIEIVGGPRILLATSYPNDPLATALRAQKFEVEIVTDLASLGVGRLAGTKAVILNNVPAHKFSPDFLAALPFYVKEQGGGLLMV